jgi:galactokinase
MKLTLFKKHFGENGKHIKNYFTPGRANLIGEHIDYNGGAVLPFALSQGISAMIRFNPESHNIRIASDQTNSILSVDLTNPEAAFRHRDELWQNYPLGVLHYLSETLKLPLVGADIMLSSNLPARSGLSSSAAIEVLIAYSFLDHANHPYARDKKAIAQLCQQVENEFIGMHCGIMDQFVVAAAQKNHAMLLQCNTLEYEHVPLALDTASLVILNTNKERSLTNSKYNERREECEEALRIIRQHKELHDLCAASVSDLNLIKDKVIKQRAVHVVNENMLVSKAAQSLKKNDWHRLGLLLNASHKSLKKDYEVSSFELDALTDAARKELSCYGARMIGAGFGGCAIALVEKEEVANFIENVTVAYQMQTSLCLDAYVSIAGEGVHSN